MKTRKVLIIEDEPEIRAILAITLRHSGRFDPIFANDGLEGIAVAAQEKPDLILLDAMMPRLDGYATCRRLKQSEQLRRIPVVFLSARTDSREIDRAMKAGAAGYVPKPFDPLTLASQIADIADGVAKQ
jgi:CheY-like chemotaxis protein